MSGAITEIPAAPVVWPVAAVVLIIGLVRLRRRESLSAARVAIAVAVALYTAAVLSLTLFPLQIETGAYGNQASWIDKINLIPVATIDPRTFLLNVLFFVPLGVLVTLLRRGATWRAAAVTGFAVSAVVEVVQGLTNVFLSSGRTADVNDLIANTLGAIAGFAMATVIFRSGILRFARPEAVRPSSLPRP